MLQKDEKSNKAEKVEKKRNFFRRHLKTIILIGVLVIFSILVIVFRRQIYDIFTVAFGGGNIEYFREVVRGWGFLGWLLFFFLQFLFTLITVVPSEPLQVLIGVVYGLGWGVLIVWLSIMAASLLLFIIARHAKGLFKRKKKEAEKLSKEIEKTKKSHIFIITLLYFLPVFTYGMITIIAATTTKLKAWQYMIIAAIGSIVYSVIIVFFGSLVVSAASQIVNIVIMVLMVVFTILIILLRKRFMALIFSKKVPLDIKLNNYKAKKPCKALARVVLPFL